MNLKRTIGTGKIFLYSCGAVMALAGIIWLIINGAYAVYISGKTPWGYYEQNSADTATPWLLMAAAMAVYYRYWKMCSASNVSCTKQTGVLALLSAFASAAFAAADLLSAKLLFERLYGGIVVTRFEDESSFFRKIIHDYIFSLDENAVEISTPYNMKTMLLLFALMALYYYGFFLAGCYIVQCFRCGRKKTLIYYAVTVLLMIFMVFCADKISPLLDDNMLIDFSVLLFVIIEILTNPVIFLVFFPYTTAGDMDSIIVGLAVMSAFIIVNVLTVDSVGKWQFPSKRQTEKFLKNKNARTAAEREEKNQ